jgi:hypothetical protein
MVSEVYARALADSKMHHQTSKTFSGSLAFPHAAAIKELVEKHEATSILDYGCGKGLQYQGENSLEAYWGVPVTKYDPAVPDFAALPTMPEDWDIIICTHSLGCVPVQDMPDVVDWMYRHARKAVYIGEFIGPVKKRIFRDDPTEFAYDWSVNKWATALRRGDMPVDVVLGTMRTDDPDRELKLQRIGASRS